MTTPQETEEAESNINSEIEAIKGRMLIFQRQLAFIEKFKSIMVNLELIPDCMCDTVDFNSLDHSKVIQVIKAFGGDWTKSPSSYAARIDYVRDQPIDGITIRCWAGTPPPNCKLVEEEITIPAQPEQKVTRMKLVCS